jgi:hypothetical protein
MKKIVRLTENDLHRIINESVKRVLKEAINEDGKFFYKGQVFQYKGEYDARVKRAFLKWKKQIDDAEARARGEEIPEEIPPKKIKGGKKEEIVNDQASPRALAQNVKKLLYDKSLASVKGFKDNGERQFGPKPLATLVNLFKKEAGEDLFIKFNMIYTGITEAASEIETWGKRNEHAVYERARKISMWLRDMDEILERMGETYQSLMNKGKIVSAFGNNANIIIGNGHSLGISSLIFAKGGTELSKVTGNLLYIANKLEEIANNGRDPLEYDPNDLRKRG